MTSSLGAFMGNASTAPYSAAKAAVNNLMYSYYKALKIYGFGATVLCPGNINTNIGEAERYRPDLLKNSGYNVTEDTINFLKTIHSSGMDPIELANWLKEGIENEQILVVPYKGSETILRNSFQEIVDSSSPEGMKNIIEADKTMVERIAKMAHPESSVFKDVGFAKAKSDIGWVDPSRKFI